MKVYQPQISIKLIKAFKRSEIVPGLSVSVDRYGNLDGLDLTHLLGDGGSVRTVKSTRQPAGGFTITLVDKPESKLLESVSALIEPMDMVEIRMAREIVPSSGGQGQPPIIMRGFVSSVNRNEVMQGDRPGRSVTIVGQDFGKVLQILQVMWLYESTIGNDLINEFRFFSTFMGDGQAKYMSASEFVGRLLTGAINPYMAKITSLPRFDAAVKSIKSDVSIDGAVSPDVFSRFDNISFYNLMRSCLDVPVWNELYVEDRQDGVYLVARPLPMKDLSGRFIQGSAGSIVIKSDAIVAQNSSRSDTGVANFFWVTNDKWWSSGNSDQMDLSMAGQVTDYVLSDYVNCPTGRFGIRKFDADINLGPSSFLGADSVKKENAASQNLTLEDWFVTRRKLLAEMNKDNVIYESGSIRMKGDETVRAGMYIDILRGSNQSSIGEVYAHTVSHEYIPFQGFFTSLQFERGNFFAKRAQKGVSSYINEIESQGVV